MNQLHDIQIPSTNSKQMTNLYTEQVNVIIIVLLRSKTKYVWIKSKILLKKELIAQIPLTFNISIRVFPPISSMMKYSNGTESTNCHTLYWKLFGFSGMNRSAGLASIAILRQPRFFVKNNNRLTIKTAYFLAMCQFRKIDTWWSWA